jgi:hypothetical protein
MILRPTPRFATGKLRAYQDRVHAKGWLAAWPRLTMQPARSDT